MEIMLWLLHPLEGFFPGGIILMVKQPCQHIIMMKIQDDCGCRGGAEHVMCLKLIRKTADSSSSRTARNFIRILGDIIYLFQPGPKHARAGAATGGPAAGMKEPLYISTTVTGITWLHTAI